jgi:DNA replication and repair protein RecF
LVIESLEIVQFRNIEKASLAFSDSFNFITGRNAQGKTNLLEAIHFFSLGRSFRTRRACETIMFGKDYFFLELSGRSDGGVGFVLDIGVEEGGRVRASADGKGLSGLIEIIGIIPSVLFVPEDVNLASGPPRLRRIFLDYTAAQISPKFLGDLKKYRAVLRNRNALLRTISNGRSAGKDLSVWDDMLVEKGAAVVRGRVEVLGEVLRHAGEFAGELLPGGENLDVRYVCSFNENGIDPERALREAVCRCRESERRRGYTLVGPHYDDAVIYLGGTDLRRFGSQGRKRLAAVMLKLAQAATIMARRAERPVVLLDDIFSELDRETASRVKGALSDRYQSFVTSPRTDDFPERRGIGAHFIVEGGRFARGDGEDRRV